MHKLFKQLKNFDLTTMGYYSFMDFHNLKFITSKFNRVETRSNYSHKKRIPTEQIFKYYNPTETRNPTWRDYRVHTFLKNFDSNNEDIQQLYVTQSETRSILCSSIIMYVELPLSYFMDDIKNTTYGEFNYDVVDEFFKRWEKDLTHTTAIKLMAEYDEKYPEIFNEEHIWRMNLEQDLYFSFKKYGQLNIPVIDRPYSIFEGSSHTLFHACYLKWDTLKVFIVVPDTETHSAKSGIQNGWYTMIPPNNFSHTHFKDSKIFYMFYIDIENEQIYSKKYPISEFKYFKTNITRLDKNLYKGWDIIL